MSYHNVRDSKGRFTKSSTVSKTTVPQTAVQSATPDMKEKYLNIFRNETCMVETTKDGKTQINILSLKSEYLTNYVGKGTSKKADSDTMFLFDVDSEMFKKIKISEIKSIIPVSSKSK